MRYGLNKPKCDRLEFKLKCHFELEINDHPPIRGELKVTSTFSDDGQNFITDLNHLGEYQSAVGNIVNSRRFINTLILEGSGNSAYYLEDVLKDLLATDTQIDSVVIKCKDRALNVKDTYLFVAFCKKFKSVTIDRAFNFNTEKVFIEILPTTTLLGMDFESMIMVSESDLTDRTLTALTTPTMCKTFNINYLATSFTVSGIKALVKKVEDTADAEVCYNLGILKREQFRNVVDWMDISNANQDCPYSIQKAPVGNTFFLDYYEQQYLVVLKRWIPGDGKFIEFGFFSEF